jgi:hypothetical protein
VGSFEDVAAMTDDQIDEELRAAGVDPDEASRLAQAAITKALDEAAVMPGSRRNADFLRLPAWATPGRMRSARWKAWGPVAAAAVAVAVAVALIEWLRVG